MASQVILKKSSVAARVPVAGDLAFGELALNYADGLLYYKKADNSTIGSFGGSTFSGIVSGLELTSTNSIGDEGGQINLAKAVTNTTLTTGVTIDVYQNKLRIFESGGTNRGVYIDLSAAATGVATNLINGGTSTPTATATIAKTFMMMGA